MPVWWRYQDVLKTVGGDDSAAVARNLMRGLKDGSIRAVADQAIYSLNGQMVREYSVTLPPGIFRDTHAVFGSEKRANFRPEIGKFFNPRVAGPDTFSTATSEQWAVDCFGLLYRGEDVIREFGLPKDAFLSTASVSVDEVLADDYSAFHDVEREAGALREGFWSPFVACAWVCSRSEQFTAAAQEYEARYLVGKRGEALGYACAAGWLVVGNLAGERYGMTFTQGLEAIRDAIGARRLGAGTGEHMGIGGRRPIEAHEWGAMRLAFERYGISPLHGLCAVQWSSADVVAAFAATMPETTALPSGVSNDGEAELKGKLPSNAKETHRKHEEYAHQAAILFRSGAASSVQDACRQVAPNEPMRQPDSIIRAIRAAYDLMYDKRGLPIKD